MIREDQTDVLVVGAGPVGMLTALLLAESGIHVKIIDQEEQTARHSYACALHPRTLSLLHQVGLAAEVLRLSHCARMVAFYEGPHRRAEIRVSDLKVDFPFLATLPQSALEAILEQKIRQKENVTIHWNHRLSGLRSEGGAVIASIDKLGISAKGYIVPEFETVVERTLHTRAAFVVGADGQHSLVRRCLGIEYERLAGPEHFATFEFGCAGSLGDEVRIGLDDLTANVLWPLPGNKYRWTFQLARVEESIEFPMKDRTPWYVVEQPSDHDSRHHLQRLVQEKAPWFGENIGELNWSPEIQFERRLAKRFGVGRCWLAGDAAHQTSPIGVQSMNVGLREAAELSRRMAGILEKKTSLDLLEDYNCERRAEWETLLGLRVSLRARDEAASWVKERHTRILPCIPASGEDLASLVNQLGLQIQ